MAVSTRARVSTLGRPNLLLDSLAGLLARHAGADAAIVSLWDCWVTHANEPIQTIDVTEAERLAAQYLSEIPFLSTLGVAAPQAANPGVLRLAANARRAAVYGAALGHELRPVHRDGRDLTMLDIWRDAVQAA